MEINGEVQAPQNGAAEDVAAEDVATVVATVSVTVPPPRHKDKKTPTTEILMRDLLA